VVGAAHDLHGPPALDGQYLGDGGLGPPVSLGGKGPPPLQLGNGFDLHS
jgi:hypothetical protein